MEILRSSKQEIEAELGSKVESLENKISGLMSSLISAEAQNTEVETRASFLNDTLQSTEALLQSVRHDLAQKQEEVFALGKQLQDVTAVVHTNEMNLDAEARKANEQVVELKVLLDQQKAATKMYEASAKQAVVALEASDAAFTELESDLKVSEPNKRNGIFFNEFFFFFFFFCRR